VTFRIRETGAKIIGSGCLVPVRWNGVALVKPELNTTMKTMKITACLLFAALPLISAAQAVLPTPVTSVSRTAGEREFTIGGAGASDRRLADSYGGMNFSYGWYTTETQMFALRQAVNYSNPRGDSRTWNGATRIAWDQHFGTRGAWLPFVGVNFGAVYGSAVTNTFAAGLEAGGKFYVQPRTFILAMVEYGWFFRRARGLDERFRNGQFNWNVGLGFNF
jgi:hypothetical protein